MRLVRRHDQVRELDTAQENVLSAVRRLQAMVDRAGCLEGVSAAMEAEDYERAAAFVADFTALQKQLGGGGAASGEGAQLSEQETKMGEARERLVGVVRARFSAASEKRDEGGALRFASLMPQLGLLEEGLQSYLGFLRASVAAAAREEFDALSASLDRAATAVPFVETLTNLLRIVAVQAETNAPVVREHFGAAAPQALVQELQKECDIRGAHVLQRFVEHRRLPALARRARTHSAARAADGDAVDPREIEGFLDEMLMLGQRVEEYTGFMLAQMRAAHGATDDVLPPTAMAMFRSGDLSQKQQEILMYYVQLEEYFMTSNVRKAIDIDEAAQDSLTSSMVDDVFFILQKCTHRAISSRNVQCACAGLNHVGNILGNDYRDALSAKLDAALVTAEHVAQRHARKPDDASADVLAAEARPALAASVSVALNNLDVSADYISKLFTVLDDSCAAFYPSAADRERMHTVLADMQAAAQALRALLKSALERACELALAHESIRAALAASKTCSYALSEEAYAANERVDPWAVPLATALESALSPLSDALSQANYDTLVLACAERVASALEQGLFTKKFSQLGGLQLDREVRTVVGAFSALASGSVRDRFARLTQVATVLNLERVAEILDYWGDNAGAITWRLSPNEIKKVLALRSDFSEHSISALQL